MNLILRIQFFLNHFLSTYWYEVSNHVLLSFSQDILVLPLQVFVNGMVAEF